MMTMKLTVNGVNIEIEGAVEVKVDGDTVKIKTREPSYPYFVPSPFWVEPPRWPQAWTRGEPQIIWGTCSANSTDLSNANITVT